MTIASPNDWQSVDVTLVGLEKYDWIVFSSTVGVDAFFARLHALGKDGRCLAKSMLAAVGAGTAAAIAKHSMRCDMVPQTPGASALADLLIHHCSGKRFLFVRNPDGETEAMDRLSEAGGEVETMDVYHQVLIPSLPESWIAQCASGEIHAIAVTSKNIADHTVALLGQVSRSQLWLSLTPAITARLHELGCIHVKTAREPSFDALMELD